MKRFEGKGTVTDVKNRVDEEGKGRGKFFQVIDVEWKCAVDDMVTVFDKDADRTRFKGKYWRDTGKLAIDKASDTTTLGVKIIGGIVSFCAAVGGTELHRFEGASVKAFKVSPEPGRNVVMRYSIVVFPASESRAGFVSMLKGREIAVIAVRAQAEMELEKEDEKTDVEQADLPGTEGVAGRKAPQQRKSVREAAAAKKRSKSNGAAHASI